MTGKNPHPLKPHILPGFLLVLATCAVYGRLLGHDFLMNWDDNVYVTANSSVHGFSVANLRAAFTSYYAGNYAPVQMISYMLDYTLWGLWAGGFLLTNMVLHAVNGLLLYVILLKSHQERLLAIVGAGIFLLHPVQVESVAWISQRKNLLAMFFMLLAWVAYLHYRNSAQPKGRLVYCASLALFSCSLLAKSASVFFPVALLMHDSCFSPRDRRVSLADTIPYFILAGAAALLAMQSQSPDVTGWSGMDFGGRRSWHGGSPWTTLLTMLPVLCSYVRMIAWPSGLSAIYDPPLHVTLGPAVLTATLLLLTAVVLSWRLYRYNRTFGYWPIFSFLAILPVSQIIPLVTLMNDRYLYFPLIGIAALGGGGAIALRNKTNMRLAMAASCSLLLILALVSFQRAGVWQSSRTLWSDAVRKVPNKFDVWEGLGEAYHLSAPVSLHEADYAYSRAFAIYSSGPNNLYNLARVKILQGDERRGMALLERLLNVNPQYVMGWAELGDLYLKRQRYGDAEHAYKMAEELQPEALEVNLRLYRLYTASGDMVQASLYAARVGALGGETTELRP